jgi:CDP-diacylglycerol---serine O-phosphatidyltransferase
MNTKYPETHNILNYIGIAACITLCGVFMAAYSVFASMADNFILAGALIIGSTICDFFDGMVARKLHEESQFGVALDGFNDFLTYILCVVIFGYNIGLNSTFSIFCLTVFLFLGTIRLARFSVTGTVNGCYEGVPVSYSILIIPLFFLFKHFAVPLNLLLVVFVIPAFFMISTIKIKKPFYKVK